MRTAANELNSWGLTVNSLDSSVSKQAMLGCTMETLVNMGSSVNKTPNKRDLLPGILDSSGCMRVTMANTKSLASSLEKSGCNSAMLVNSEVTSASKLCLWDCTMGSSVNRMDLLCQEGSSGCLESKMEKPTANAGSKATFHQASLATQD